MKEENDKQCVRKVCEFGLISTTLTPCSLIKLIAVVILTIATGCTEEKPTTWDDVKSIKLRSSVDGVDFDVPLNYHYRLFNKNLYNWPAFSDEIRTGKTRKAVDYINIDALLPDVVPVSEQNLEYFMELGWGRKIRAFITHPRSFEYYFKYTAPTRLEHLPDSPDVPGMLHYRDNITQGEFFLSHDHAVPELTRIRCPFSRPGQHPRCTVETQYRYEKNLDNKSETISTSTPFYLNYSFSRSYLSQWREIDHKLKALYDQFAQSAERHFNLNKQER